MKYAQNLGVKEFQLKWERANAIVNDKYGNKKEHVVRKAMVDMEDCEDIIKGALIGTRCKCGDPLTMDCCDVCGKTIIGCMHCHLEAHALDIDVQPLFLADSEVIHTSDLQYEGIEIEKEKEMPMVIGEIDLNNDNCYYGLEYYRSREKEWLERHSM